MSYLYTSLNKYSPKISYQISIITSVVFLYFFKPRNYDTIARYHQANVGRSAHGGPAFLPWHRIYLLM